MTEHPTDAQTKALIASCRAFALQCEPFGVAGVLNDAADHLAIYTRMNAARSQDTVGHAWERALRERLTAAESEGRTMVPITTLELRGLIAARTTPIADADAERMCEHCRDATPGTFNSDMCQCATPIDDEGLVEKVAKAIEAERRQWFCSGIDCKPFDHGRDEGFEKALAAFDRAALSPLSMDIPGEGVEALVGKLNLIWQSDHERGCEGRCYTCSCGFDEKVWKNAQGVSAVLAASLPLRGEKK